MLSLRESFVMNYESEVSLVQSLLQTCWQNSVWSWSVVFEVCVGLTCSLAENVFLD